MGRADRAAGSNSDRCSERSRKIGQVRTKRKKRKRDLEELHRNVLKAKHNARLRANQPKIKRRTNFAKVLGNFADKRRDNEGEDEVLEDGEPRRKKPKKICERLLPVPMVGIYQNGAKGREIRRAVGHLNETGVARLQSNVLKLLKGDETSAKSSRERNDREAEEKKKKKNKRGNPDRPSDDDSNDSEESQSKTVRCSLVEDRSILPKTKGPKRTGSDEMKLPEVREQTRKDEANELSRQRDEAKCRRRLFEPDEDAIAKNRFGLIDRTMTTNHEIRFSPSRTKNTAEETEGEAVSRPDPVIDKIVSNDNFWGWSPVTCYERLCAMISIDNFENKSHHRHRLPDPVVKIQKILRGLYTHNSRRMRERAAKLLVDSNETRENTSTWKSMGTSNEEEEEEGEAIEEEGEAIEEEMTIQACTQDESDMEQCSSLESSITMIGSWHQKNVQRYRSNDDSSGVFETKIKTTARFKRSRKNEMTKMDVEMPMKEDAKRKDFSSSVVTDTTNDSVLNFLEKFRCHNSLNNEERHIFRMEIDGNARTNEDRQEKLKVCLKTPPCGKKSTDNPRCGLRRNTMKHVPTILRRANEHMGHVEETIHEKNSRGIHPPNVERRAENINSLPDDDTSSFFSLRHFPTPTKDIRSIEERAIFLRPDAMLGESNYYRQGTTFRETGQRARHEHQQFGPAHFLESKLAPMRVEHEPNSKMLSSQDLRAKGWRENNYDESQRDRGNATTNVQAFATESSGKNCTCENLFLPEDQPRLGDFPTDPAGYGGDVGGFARDRVRFLDGQFFNADDDCVRNERLGGSFEVGKNDHDPGAHKILTSLPRKAQQDNPRGCERFSSFEFTRPQIDPYSQRFNDPKDITGKKLTVRDPEAPKLTVFRGRNTSEPSVNGDLANKPSFPCPSDKRLGTSTFRYAKAEYKMSEKSNSTQSELEPLESLQQTFENAFPIERINPSLVKQHRGIIGKPVVVFRPIEASRQKRTKQPQINDSRNHDNSKSIAMREALTNLRVMTFDDTTSRHCSRELDHSECHHTEQQPGPPSECERSLIRDLPDQLNLRSFDAWTQPAKFRAYECDEEGNPRRIPIYQNFNVTNVSGRSKTENDASSFLTIVDDKVNVNGTVYVRSNETAGPGKKQAVKLLQQLPTGAMTNQNYLCNNDSNIILRSTSDVTAKEQQQQQCSRRVALMVPHFPSPHGHHRSNLASSTLDSTAGPNPISNTISAGRILYTANDRQRLSRTPQSRTVEAPIAVTRGQRYDPSRQFEGRNSQVTASRATERIRLSDGRIGILLTENSTIGNHPRRLNFNPDPSSDMFTSQPDPSVEAGYVYKLATDDGAIYSQPDYQWNTVRESLGSCRGINATSE